MPWFQRLFSPTVAIVASWTLWYTAVVATNLTDLLRVWGLLPDDFAWVSGNYTSFVEPGGGGGVVIALYLGGYVWELATTALFWRALIGGARGSAPMAELARAPFTLGIGFWGAFLVLAEIGGARTQAVHLGLFTATIASLLTVELLGRRPPADG